MTDHMWESEHMPPQQLFSQPAKSEHDPLCPSAEVPNSGCLCPWIRDTRADEDEKIAQAIEALPEVWAELNPAYRRGWDAATRHAARITRNGGRND